MKLLFTGDTPLFPQVREARLHDHLALWMNSSINAMTVSGA